MELNSIISSILTRSDVIIVVAGFLVYLFVSSKNRLYEREKTQKEFLSTFENMGTAKHQQLKETQELHAQQVKNMTSSFMAGNERLAQAIEKQGGDIKFALEKQSERMEGIMRNTMMDSKEILKFYRNK